MTLKKMMELGLWIAEQGINPRAVFIGVGTGGELTLNFQEQLDRHIHKELLKKRFVYHDATYTYRP